MTVITGQALIVPHSSCSYLSYTHTHTHTFIHWLGWMHTTHELTRTVYCSTHTVNHTSRTFVSVSHWDVHHIINLSAKYFFHPLLLLRLLHLVAHLATFPFSLIAGFQCGYPMHISPLSPTWARWQLQGFQAERRRSSTSIICGDPCHKHTRAHDPPACTLSTYKARYRTHTHTHTHTHTYKHTLYYPRMSPAVPHSREQSKQIQRHDRQTDSQTYHYLSFSIRVGCLTIAGLRTTAFSPMIL